MAALVAASAAPLALRWIPRNPRYGFRSPAALASDDAWYAINGVRGVAFVVAALIALALLVWFPAPLRRVSWLPVLVLPALLGLAHLASAALLPAAWR